MIGNIAEKIKNIEKRKKRIKEIKDEIKALEKTENIPSYKINEKRLEFFKEKFKESLTCPISLEIFKDPVIVASGHTYEREYILRIISETGKDPETREKLKIEDIIDNCLAKKIIQ